MRTTLRYTKCSAKHSHPNPKARGFARGKVREEGQGRGFFPKVTLFHPSVKGEVSKGQQAAAECMSMPALLPAPHAVLCSLHSRPARLQLCTCSALQILRNISLHLINSTLLWLLILSKKSAFTEFSSGVEKRLEKNPHFDLGTYIKYSSHCTQGLCL